jgi:hypothetical protein
VTESLLWRLHRRGLSAACETRQTESGVELVVTIRGFVISNEAMRAVPARDELAAEWMQMFEASGWSSKGEDEAMGHSADQLERDAITAAGRLLERIGPRHPSTVEFTADDEAFAGLGRTTFYEVTRRRFFAIGRGSHGAVAFSDEGYAMAAVALGLHRQDPFREWIGSLCRELKRIVDGRHEIGLVPVTYSDLAASAGLDAGWCMAVIRGNLLLRLPEPSRYEGLRGDDHCAWVPPTFGLRR